MRLHEIRIFALAAATLVAVAFLPAGGCELIYPAKGRVCPNKVCEKGENCQICPADCGQCTGNNDGMCTDPENAINDPDECSCGNTSCDVDENCETCPADCGDCQYANGTSDGFCQPSFGENPKNAPKDCGCGDGICMPPDGENSMTCRADCEK